MGLNVGQKLISSHLVEGEMIVGQEIGLRIDQTLTQDATGTLVMLELEAMGVERVETQVSVQYVDHNLVQEDNKNADDHLFLLSACKRFGIWYSRPGNGVSHPVHQERFGRPGATLLGSDSHTPSAGAIGMLAVGTGGLEVALAMAGYPYYVKMPKILGVRLVGKLPDWVSAKDVILEMLRRHTVKGGVGRIIEYYGPGLEGLSAMDRHVIANMGAELGATTSVFPSDDEVRRFLRSQQREDDWIELKADPDAQYDEHEEIDLSQLEPMIAMPSSPDNVRPVREVAGEVIYQSYIGSSANPGYRDIAVAAQILKERRAHDRVSLDINPASRQILDSLLRDKHIGTLIRAGARLHQAGCNGCIGMGQAPATKEISLRTVPRNFPGRSGTVEDKVCLVSPETAAASALTGVITDPRTLDMPYPRVEEPQDPTVMKDMLTEPEPLEKALKVDLHKGPNIQSIPEIEPPPEILEVPVLLKVGNNISTDEIMPAGAKVLPFRSNIPRISEFCFGVIDDQYPEKARKLQGHCVVGGLNYGQGSSREHAALAPRYLGLRMVLALGFARIHWQNLINFGILPLKLENQADYQSLQAGNVLRVEHPMQQLHNGRNVEVINTITGDKIIAVHDLSPRQVGILEAGGLINLVRNEQKNRK